MDQEILDQFGKVGTTLEKFGESQTKFHAQLAELNETAKKVLAPKDTKTLEKTEDTKTLEQVKAELEESGIVGGITGLEVWDIPVGQALVGGFVAVFASELIDGVFIKQGDMIKGVIKLVGAGVAVKWGGRLLGSTGSKALAILLAYDGIRSLVPIDTWAKRGATAVTGIIPGGGLGGFTKDVDRSGNGHQGDYYEALKGGAR